MHQGRYLLNAVLIMSIMAFLLNEFGLPLINGDSFNAIAQQETPSNVEPIGTGTIIKGLTNAHDRPRLLVIYASWCPYCKQQLPALQSYANGANLQVLGLSIDEDYQALSRYLAANWNNAPYFGNYVFSKQDSSNFKRTMREMGIDFSGGIPHLALFDKEGKLRFQSGGMIPVEEVDRWLRNL